MSGMTKIVISEPYIEEMIAQLQVNIKKHVEEYDYQRLAIARVELMKWMILLNKLRKEVRK